MSALAEERPQFGGPDPDEVFGSATIPRVLELAERSKRGIAFIDRRLAERELTYPELAGGARVAAAALAARGVGPGDRVCLMSSTSVELVVALMGVWRAGGVPVILPLPRRRSELAAYFEEVGRRLELVEARALVVADSLLPLLPKDALPVPVAACGEVARAGGETRDPVATEPDDLAYLQFTSGTTGSSRAVALTHRQILSNVAGLTTAFGFDPADAAHVSWLPLYHDMGLITLLCGVANAGRLVLEPPEEFMSRPGSWIEAIARHGGTSTAAPNFAYALVARDLARRPRELDLSRLRMAGNGAEPVDVATLDAFVEAAAPYGFDSAALCPMYGLAEATVAVTVSSMDKPFRREWIDRDGLEQRGEARVVDADSGGARLVVGCGPPIPGVTVAIAAEDGAPRPDGQVGEIRVRGPSVMVGYWDDPDVTSATLRDGWLRTGDLGYLRDGELYVCGRIKDMIIVGGRNLYPEDYEQCALSVEGVRQHNAVAFAVRGTERMVVVAEPAIGAAESEDLADRVMKTLADRLSHAPQEVAIVPRNAVPRTSSGKPRRRVCRELYESGELPRLAVASR